MRQLNDRGEPEACGQARDHEAGSPPPHDRQAPPSEGGQGQRASGQAGQDDGDATGRAQELEKPSGPGPGKFHAQGQHGQPGDRQREMNAITTAAGSPSVRPSSTTASQAIITTTEGANGCSVQNAAGTLAVAAAVMAPCARARRMNTTGGAIRLHDGQGVLPGVGGQSAGDPAYPDRQAAGGQVHRFPQARGALPGPGGGQRRAEHLLPVDLAVGGRVAAQQAQVAPFQGGCPGRVPHQLRCLPVACPVPRRSRGASGEPRAQPLRRDGGAGAPARSRPPAASRPRR